MKLGELILKIGSAVFLFALVIIITFTFGVPNFLGLSQETDDLILGKINGDIVTKREVLQAYSNYKRNNFEGEEVPQQYKKLVLERVTEQITIQKVLYQMYKNNYFSLTKEESSKNFLEYLKNNFPDYVSEKTGNFLIKKFQREVLVPNQITLDSLEDQNKRDFTLQKNQEFFDKLSLISHRDVYERMTLINTDITLQIVKINNKVIEENIFVSQKEIQDYFKKEYLSKDKDSKLTETKKEDIIQQIQKSKLPDIQERESKKIERYITNNTNLINVAQANNTRVYSVKMQPLSSLRSERPELEYLDESVEFKTNILSGPKNTNIGPFYDEDSNLFLIRVIKRKIPDIPNIQELKKQHDSPIFQTSFLDSLDNEIAFNTNYDQLKSQYLQQIIYSTYDILKQKSKIDLRPISVENL